MNEQTHQLLFKIGKIALIIFLVLFAVFVVYRISIYMLPFIIAFAVSYLMEPLIRMLMRKTKMSRKVASIISLLFILFVFGLILFGIIFNMINEIKSLYNQITTNNTVIYDNINIFLMKVKDFYMWLPPEVTENINNLVSSLTTSLKNILTPLVGTAFKTAISIPEAIIFVVITILSTYFMAADRALINEFITNQFPESWIKKVQSIRDDMFSALFGYLRAQLILMTITFTELSIGFSIIKVKYSLLLAFVISIIDAFPILGTGGVLVPWSIYSFVVGDIKLGISLLVIYAIVLVVRQLTEPKILGHQIGVHPLLTLFAMYTGLQLIGFAGLILGPITFLLLKSILSGIFKDSTFKDMITKK